MEKIFNYVGMAVLFAFGIVILMKITNFQVRIIESFTASSKDNDKRGDYGTMVKNAVKAIKEKNDRLRSGLSLNDKNIEKDYVELMDEYGDMIDILMFQNIYKNFNANKDLDGDNMKAITQVNELKQFRDAIDDVVTYLKSG